MKRIPLLAGLIIIILTGISNASTDSEKKPHRWNAVRQYFTMQILPVLNERRVEFDAWLSESERNELNDCRRQINLLNENVHKTFREHSETFPERSATMLTDEQRNQKHMQMKELFGRIHTIAKNHRNELDNVFNDLTAQRKQWMDDISKLLTADEEKPFSFLQNSMEDHHGPLKMWSRAAFLILDPAKSITTDGESKVAAADILPSSGAESMNMFPNPAISQFHLDLENIPVDNKLIITDMEGKTMLEKENLLSSENIDCSSFPAGIYFVQLRSGDDIMNKKLIVNH